MLVIFVFDLYSLIIYYSSTLIVGFAIQKRFAVIADLPAFLESDLLRDIRTNSEMSEPAENHSDPENAATSSLDESGPFSEHGDSVQPASSSVVNNVQNPDDIVHVRPQSPFSPACELVIDAIMMDPQQHSTSNHGTSFNIHLCS